MEKIGERFGPLLRGFLTQALGDPGAVEDVLQLTLMDIWKRGPTYDPQRASVGTWMLVIARSRVIDHLRRRVPEPHDPETVARVVDQDADDETAALVERWRVAGLLAGIPRQEARLLWFRFYGGLTQAQIAQRTGLPLGTVKMQMVRALERLREAIEREDWQP